MKNNHEKDFAYSFQDWYERCQDGELIEFTDELQQIILDAHNKLRNQLALGQTPGFEPAKRMSTMVN